MQHGWQHGHSTGCEGNSAAESMAAWTAYDGGDGERRGTRAVLMKEMTCKFNKWTRSEELAWTCPTFATVRTNCRV